MNNFFVESEYAEEWYQPELTCGDCHGRFMTEGNPSYCPYCGLAFDWLQRGNDIICFRGGDDNN